MKPHQAIKALETLKKSTGWKLIEQAVEEDILQAAKQLASSPTMSEKETDFRRGAIWAADKFAGLPDLLVQINLNNLALTSAKAETEKTL